MKSCVLFSHLLVFFCFSSIEKIKGLFTWRLPRCAYLTPDVVVVVAALEFCGNVMPPKCWFDVPPLKFPARDRPVGMKFSFYFLIHRKLIVRVTNLVSV